MGATTLTRILSGSQVALDTVSLVYFLERHHSFFRPAKALFERIEKGTIQAVATTLVFSE